MSGVRLAHAQRAVRFSQKLSASVLPVLDWSLVQHSAVQTPTNQIFRPRGKDKDRIWVEKFSHRKEKVFLELKFEHMD